MMDNSITYVGSTGERVEMRIDGKWHYGETDLHDYEWAYDTVADRVAGFRREPRDYSLRVMMGGGDVDERNRAIEVFERDVAAAEPGTLVVGASSMRCWVTASSKSGWWYDEATMTMDLTVHADDPMWTREAGFEFTPRNSIDPGSGVDYPFDYAFDYAAPDRSDLLENPFSVPCSCRITVYGPAVNPYLIIGDNRYQVDVTVEDGGLIIIDGSARTITARAVNGVEVNAFALGVREEGASVFAKVPAGTSPVSWSGSFGFRIDVIEERSEPVWA